MLSLQQVSLGSWLHWPQAGSSVQYPFPCYPSAAFIFSKVREWSVPMWQNIFKACLNICFYQIHTTVNYYPSQLEFEGI